MRITQRNKRHFIIILICVCFILTLQYEKLDSVKHSRNQYFKKILGHSLDSDSLNNIRIKNAEYHSLKINNSFYNSSDIDDYEWSNIGPYNIGGHTNAIAIDRRNSSVVFAGGDSGGIWKSSDNGNSWTFITPPDYSLNINAIKQHPISEDYWFYGAEDLYKSYDNGNTWEKLNFRDDFTNVNNIHFNSLTGNMFIGTGSFLFKSENMGEMFEPILNDIVREEVYITESGKIYVLRNGNTPSDQGLFESVNDGLSFSKIMDLNSNILNNDLIKLRISKENEDACWLLSANLSFSQINLLKINLDNGSFIDRGANLPFIETQNGYNFIFEVSPDNHNLLVLGGVSLYRSIDGFNTPVDYFADFITGGFPNHHVDNQSFCWNPNQGFSAYSGHDGGISFTEDIREDGFNIVWENKNNGYLTTQFYTVAIGDGFDDDRVMGGTQDNSVPFVKYNSFNFQSPEYIGGDGFSCHFGEVYAYQSAQFGSIFRLEYGTNQAPVAASATLLYQDSNNPDFDTKFVVNSNADYMVYGSKNNLAILSNITENSPDVVNISIPEINGGFISCLTLDEQSNTLYIGALLSSGAPRVYKLENINSINSVNDLIDITPNNLANSSFLSSISLDKQNNKNILICTSNIPTLNYSMDGGQTYQSIIGDLFSNDLGFSPFIFSTMISKNSGTNVYWIGTSAGLYKTNFINGENTNWEIVAPEKFGLSYVLDLKTRKSDDLVVAATYGRGIVVGKNKNSLSNQEFEIKYLSLVPNPNRGEFNIILKNHHSIIYSVQIFNSSGKQVYYKKLQTTEKGIKIKNLSEGLYFVKILIDDELIIKKMLIHD